jgi:hypothetical protein
MKTSIIKPPFLLILFFSCSHTTHYYLVFSWKRSGVCSPHGTVYKMSWEFFTWFGCSNIVWCLPKLLETVMGFADCVCVCISESHVIFSSLHLSAFRALANQWLKLLVQLSYSTNSLPHLNKPKNIIITRRDIYGWNMLAIYIPYIWLKCLSLGRYLQLQHWSSTHTSRRASIW